MPLPAVGTTNKCTWIVGRDHLASSFGSGLVDALATPVLVGFCEECARTLVDAALAPAQQTVGTRVDLEHIAATPLGMCVTVHVTLEDVDGRKLRFALEASDEEELIGRGTHERFIVDVKRFASGVEDKRTRLSQ